MLALRRHRFARLGRLGRLGVALVVLDLALVAGFAGLAGGVATGSSPTLTADGGPFRLLGTTLGVKTCPEVPLAVGKGIFVVCPTWTGVLSPARVVEVVSIYGPGNSVVDPYAGELPGGLDWGQPLSATMKLMGRPNRITSAYGTPTLVFFFKDQPYGSLELRFDGDEHLKRINASLVR